MTDNQISQHCLSAITKRLTLPPLQKPLSYKMLVKHRFHIVE
ncbi:Uncharacterised protein [Yersinia frederiksenii]|nr:Uncharacterised protein [Yersinia frederiksenii]CNL23103.1 Uncharacterised protein [Yersinia frederiksenii]CQJ02217.1 Uncharacterised protein [Yersinia frederiksenii]